MGVAAVEVFDLGREDSCGTANGRGGESGGVFKCVGAYNEDYHALAAEGIALAP